MARVRTQPKQDEPIASNFEEEAIAAHSSLQALRDGAAETGQHSVDTCAAMIRLWTAHVLTADASYLKQKTKANLLVLAKASEQLGEWEKRKAGAMVSTRVDLLREVLARLDEQNELAAELEEIEE